MTQAALIVAVLFKLAGGVDPPANTPPCMYRLHPTLLCAPPGTVRKLHVA